MKRNILVLLVLFISILSYSQININRMRSGIIMFQGGNVNIDTTPIPTVSCDSIVPCDAIIPCNAIYTLFINESFYIKDKTYFKHEENLTV